MLLEEDSALVEVVISGISGKFPQSENTEELKKHLLEKTDLVTDENCRWNKDKWKNIPSTFGKINVVRKFDDTFFGIYSKIVDVMDPLTRCLLERSYEAIMDAGLNPKSINGTNTGVYTAVCHSDSEASGMVNYWLLAHAKSLMSNRISYAHNLQGPSITIISSWTGAVECIQQAVFDIRSGRVNAAIVGASNIILFPEMFVHWLGLEKLSPDGKCRSFDADANGYGRSEGVVVLLLQKASEAKRSYGTIVHVEATLCTDINSRLLTPSLLCMKNFLNSFYLNCDISPSSVAYIEADGSANKRIDEIEMNALGDVFCGDNCNRNLLVGSVKSNLGHTETASSLVSLAKGLICLDSGIIPPNIHYSHPNPNIRKLQSGQMQVVLEPTVLPANQYIAINTIGLTNSMGHILLKQNSKGKKVILDTTDKLPRLVLVSGRHENGILNCINKLESIPFDPEYFSLVNDVFKENISCHFYRGFTILGTKEKRMHFTLETGELMKKPVWFVFAGMGSQWPGMGADLMSLPVFANAINELDTYLTPLGVDIKDVITSYNPMILKNIVNCFVGIAAIQIAMVDVLYAVGIKPDGMLGHSLGENCCGYADGCLTKYQAIMSAYYRGKSSEQIELKKKGLMVAVGLGFEQLKNLPKNIQIACHNSDDSVTISGIADDVQSYVRQLQKQNIFVKPVNSNSIPYHSKYVNPLAPYVLENIRKIIPNPKKRSSRWISTSIPEHEWNTPLAETCSAEYQVNNFLHTVYFAEACKHIPENALVIEISPHGLFQSILKRSLHDTCFNIPLGKRETGSSLNFLLSAIGKLYVAGLQPDVNALYPKIEYPVSRGTPSLADLATWNHEKDWEVTKLVNQDKIKALKLSLCDKKWRYLTHYKINGLVVAPISLLLLETLQVFQYNEDLPIFAFENISIKNCVEITADGVTAVYTRVQYGSGNFEISTDSELLLTGKVSQLERNIFQNYKVELFFDDSSSTYFSEKEIYDIFEERGFSFSNEFQNIKFIRLISKGYSAEVTWHGNLEYFIASLIQVKLFVDLCTSGLKFILPSTILKLLIDLETIKKITPGTDVSIVAENATGILQCAGIEFHELKMLPHSVERPIKQIKIESLQFIPHANTELLEREGFLLFCCQLITECFTTKLAVNGISNLLKIFIVGGNGDNNHDKTTKINNQDSLHCSTKITAKMLQMLRKQLPLLKIQVFNTDINELEFIKPGPSVYPLLVFYNTGVCYDKVSSFANKVEELFLLSWTGVHHTHKLFATITRKIFPNGEEISLQKKMVQVDKSMIIEINPVHKFWLNNLCENLLFVKPHKCVFIHWSCKLVTEVINTISQIIELGLPQKLRFIIMMDEFFPKFDLDEPFYKEQLTKGIVINIFKDNAWGSVVNIPVNDNFVHNVCFQKFDRFTKRIQDTIVKFLALSPICQSQYSAENQVDTTCVEYSGVLKDGKHIMGIVDINGPKNENGKIKPIFQWILPDSWKLKDAVSVPLAYVKVYYGLIIKGKLVSKSQILVYSGHTILGECAIAICLSYGCKVFTTVNTIEERNYVTNRFNNSELLHVIGLDENSLSMAVLKLTNGEGVNVVINASSREQIEESSLCLLHYGTMIQIIDDKLETGIYIGMEMFMKSISFFAVTTLDILKANPDIVCSINRLISNGLEEGVIKPFEKRIYLASEIYEALKFINENSETCKTVINYSEQNIDFEYMTCNSDICYLIIGDICNTWYSVVVWLLEHGVVNFIFAQHENSVDEWNHYAKRLNLILNKYDVHIMFTFIETLEESFSIIGNLGTLDGIFCIGLNAETVNNVDKMSRKFVPKLNQFICIKCNGARVCESRKLETLTSLNISVDNSVKDISSVLNEITSIVCHTSNRSFFPLIQITSNHSYRSEGSNEILNFLPMMTEAKCILDHVHFSEDVYFEKVVSRCSHYDEMAQSYPIFVLPGVNWITLKPLITQLIYPVFSAVFNVQTSASCRDVALSLVKPLKQIQPKGPYTILAETWSGAISIELMSLLENEDGNTKVRLILLEGIPHDLQLLLKEFFTFSEDDFQQYLINVYNVKNRIGDEILKKMPLNSRNSVENSVDLFTKEIYGRVINLHNYIPLGVKLHGRVIAIKFTNNSVFDTHVNFEQRQEIPEHP